MALTPIIQSDVTDFAQELSAVSSGAWVDVLAYVNEWDSTILGDSAQTIRMARIFLAAHLGTMSIRGADGSAGPVVGESAGALRRSYGQLAMAASVYALGMTPYGLQFLSLLSMSNARGPFLV